MEVLHGNHSRITIVEGSTNQMEVVEVEVDAEKQHSKLSYVGEKPRYNFELHVSKPLQAHLYIAKAGGDMRGKSKAR
jgi:hypothetical protein